MVASVPQVLVPHLEQRLLGLPDGTADIGPRFVDQLALRARKRLPEDARWLGASAFHFGYAAFWGALYALAYERRPVPPLLGGLLLSAGIWAVAFPGWGGAVQTGTEPPPAGRSWQRELVLLTAPLVFGMGTGLLYARGRRAGRSTRPHS